MELAQDFTRSQGLPRDVLQDRLSKKKLAIQDVVGDGACQFRAASAVLHGTQEEHNVVRAKAVAELIKHPTRYCKFVEGDYNAFCRRAALPSEWGDNITLQAIANAYEVTFVVTTENFEVDHDIVVSPTFPIESKGVLNLGFYAEQHYVSTKSLYDSIH